jgi:hypothetical protein
MTQYELRSIKGRPLMAFDNLNRAIEYQMAHQKRIGTKLRLFEVRRVEQELAA